MPNKYPEKKGWKVPKQKFKVTNWSEYTASLRQRGNISVWLSDDAMAQWYEKDRVYDGTGTPKLYSDFAIITCHEIRLVYKLPLRQSFGDAMHARDFPRQQQEAMIASGALNKMTSLGMPQSRRSA